MIQRSRFCTLFALLLLLGLAHNANAGLISAGYTLDAGSNIVTGGGLEWLQWDETKGHSIDSALSSYSGDGWRLASNIEVANLFNNAGFGGVYGADETLSYTYSDHIPYGESGSYDEFLDMFGLSVYDYYCNLPCTSVTPPGISITGALFGADLNEDGYYNRASVIGDYEFEVLTHYPGHEVDEQFTMITHPGEAELSPVSEYDIWASYPTYYDLSGVVYKSQDLTVTLGVALVRVDVPISPVPAPPALILFAFGLAGLGLAKRRIGKAQA
jgi:hypothetical protein